MKTTRDCLGLRGVVFLTAFVILAVTPGSFAKVAETFRAGPATEPVDLSLGPQLFVDEYLIAKSDGVERVTQHPQRFLDGPVLGWREHTTQPWFTVLRDHDTGKFRMWYHHGSGEDAAVAYAESADGIKWSLPRLDIVGPDNRLFIIGRTEKNGSYGASVIDDRDNSADPKRRYKLMWFSAISNPPGGAVAWSGDGFHWTQYGRNAVIPFYPPGHPKAAVGTGDIVEFFYDPIRQRYTAIIKLHGQKSDGWAPGPRGSWAWRRLVGQSVSQDFLNWTEPRMVMAPEARDDGLLEFYGAGGTIARGGLLIAFVRMLHDDYSPEPGGEPTGIGYTTLATSRDGDRWERHDDVFFDRNPQPDTWDRAMTWIGSVVPVGDEVYLYYGGYKRGHKIEANRERQIGLAKMPVDRFVSREARGGNPGMLRTVPLQIRAEHGDRLVLNADASNGTIRLQVRDKNGQVVPGLSFDECEPVTGDRIALPVRWRTKGTLARLNGQIIRLEFEITDAKLFGFDIQRNH